MRNKTEVWKYINKKRGTKTWVENNIGKKDRRKHFKELLDGGEEEEDGEGKKKRIAG